MIPMFGARADYWTFRVFYGEKLNARLSDLDEPREYRLIEPPAWIYLTRAGELVATPSEDAVGEHTFVVRCREPRGVIVERTLVVIVE